MVIFHSCARLSDGIYICMSQICLTWAHSRNSSQSTGCKWEAAICISTCQRYSVLPQSFHSQIIHGAGIFTHRTRGLPRGQTPRADPATINPLERLTSLLLGFHWGVIQVIKSPGPMEQFAKFLLGFHVGFIQVMRPPRPHGTIHHISVRVSCRVYTSSKIPPPHATIRVSFRVL